MMRELLKVAFTTAYSGVATPIEEDGYRKMRNKEWIVSKYVLYQADFCM